MDSWILVLVVLTVSGSKKKKLGTNAIVSRRIYSLEIHCKVNRNQMKMSALTIDLFQVYDISTVCNFMVWCDIHSYCYFFPLFVWSTTSRCIVDYFEEIGFYRRICVANHHTNKQVHDDDHKVWRLYFPVYPTLIV